MITKLLIPVILFFSYTTPETAPDNDKIKVMEVNFDGDLQDGEEATFEVVVKYLLESQEKAIIMIGFNNGDEIGQMKMVDSEFQVVEKGDGKVVFNITSQVKDWGSEGDFMVHVNLSEHPLPKGRWNPMAGDRYVIIPEKW